MKFADLTPSDLTLLSSHNIALPESFRETLDRGLVTRTHEERVAHVNDVVSKILDLRDLSNEALSAYSQACQESEFRNSVSALKSRVRHRLARENQEIPEAFQLTELEKRGERVLKFLEQTGSNLEVLERRLGHVISPEWAATYDPLITAYYRTTIVQSVEQDRFGYHTADSSLARHRELGLTPAFQAYDQPYGIDRYLQLSSSLVKTVNADQGDLAKYEIHKIVRHRKEINITVQKLRTFERGEHFDAEQFKGSPLFSDLESVSFDQVLKQELIRSLKSRIIERDLQDMGTDVYLISYDGGKVPGGLTLSGYNVAWTQHNSIVGTFGEEIGHYERIVENGQPNGMRQVMLMVVNRAKLDWGTLLTNLIDRELGNFIQYQPLEDLNHPDGKDEFHMRLAVGGTYFKVWTFPNKEIRSRFINHLADKFKAALHEKKVDRLELTHPDDYELSGSIFCY